MRRVRIIDACHICVAGAILFAGELIAVSPLPAFDLGIGAVGYYSKWSPAWRSGLMKFESQPDYLAGPFVSLSFLDNWTVSIVGLTSLGGNGGSITYIDNAHKGYTTSLGFGPTTITSVITGESIDATSTRWDVDSTLGYRINEFFRVFVGCKYLYNKFSGTNTIGSRIVFMPSGLTYDQNDPVAMESKFESHSGGVGIGFSLPLLGALYLLGNASCIYTKASLHVVKDVDGVFATFNGAKSNKLPGMDPGVQFYNAIGLNSTLSLSYYFEAISTSIVIGGRYQMIRYNRVERDPYHVTTDDIYYGMMFSVLYYLSL